MKVEEGISVLLRAASPMDLRTCFAVEALTDDQCECEECFPTSPLMSYDLLYSQFCCMFCNVQQCTNSEQDKKSPSTQKYALLIVTSLQCLSFTVQDDVYAQLESQLKACKYEHDL